jgi:hypothetical protein
MGFIIGLMSGFLLMYVAIHIDNLIKDKEIKELTKINYNMKELNILAQKIIESEEISVDLAKLLLEDISNINHKLGKKNLKKASKEYNKKQFDKSVEVVMKYLCENHNPHSKVIIDGTTAELLYGKKVHITDKFIID